MREFYSIIIMATSVFGTIAARISALQQGIYAPLCNTRASQDTALSE